MDLGGPTRQAQSDTCSEPFGCKRRNAWGFYYYIDSMSLAAAGAADADWKPEVTIVTTIISTDGMEAL